MTRHSVDPFQYPHLAQARQAEAAKYQRMGDEAATLGLSADTQRRYYDQAEAIRATIQKKSPAGAGLDQAKSSEG